MSTFDAHLKCVTNVTFKISKARYNRIAMKQIIFVLAVWLLSGFVLAASPSPSFSAEAVRLGVLEFENVTKDTTFDWVSRGIQESLSSKLASLPNVVVIERGQINKLLQEQRLQASGFVDTETAVELGKIIGIKKAVTGSYQVSAAKILISARVVDVETAETSAGFEAQGNVDDIFNQYTNLATNLSGALGDGPTAAPVQVENLAQEAKQEMKRQDTNSFSAYEYYTKANEIAFGSDSWITAMIDLIDSGVEVDDSITATEQAMELLEKAVEIDPNYARAWALMGFGYASLNDVGKAENAMNKALALAADDPFILCTAGVFRSFASEQTVDNAKALAAFRQVRRDFPGTYYSGLASLFVVLLEMTKDEQWMLGHATEGLRLLTEARSNMPEAGFVRAFHGMFAIVQLFGDMEKNLSPDTTLVQLRDMKSRLDTAVVDIDGYIREYPKSMLVGDINTFLPDAKGLQSMFGALETMYEIDERTGKDPQKALQLPEAERKKYAATIRQHLSALDTYKRQYPNGQLVEPLNSFMPSMKDYADVLETGAPPASGPGAYPPAGGKQQQGTISLQDGLTAASNYIAAGDANSAVELLASLDQIYPNTFEIYYMSGLAYVVGGDYETAASIFVTCVQSWPGEAEPYYWVGVAYDYFGDWGTAYDYYYAYLTMAPNGDFYAEAYNRCLEIEQQAGSYYS